MDRLGAVGGAIIAKLSAGTTPSALGAGTASIVDSYASRSVTYPIVVIDPMGGYEERSVSTEINSPLWRVQVVSNERWPREARTIMGLIEQDMHDAALSISGGTVLHCQREGQPTQFQDQAQLWHVAAYYRIEFSKALGG